MKKKLKTLYLLFTSILITVINLPFAFAKSAASRLKPNSDTAGSVFNVNDVQTYVPAMRTIYDSLHLNLAGLSKEAYEHAKKGFDKLVAQGKVLNDSILAIVDFSLPSSQKRLFVIDTRNYKVLHNSLVAHGRNSGEAMARSFSNMPESFKSSPGFYVTRNTYNGSNGYSLKLDGLEKGINDKAYERAIVMHGADYVSEAFIHARGFIGRSYGCPAVPVAQAKPIINTLKDGSCLFIYTPDESYLNRSSIL